MRHNNQSLTMCLSSLFLLLHKNKFVKLCCLDMAQCNSFYVHSELMYCFIILFHSRRHLKLWKMSMASCSCPRGLQSLRWWPTITRKLLLSSGKLRITYSMLAPFIVCMCCQENRNGPWLQRNIRSKTILKILYFCRLPWGTQRDVKAVIFHTCIYMVPFWTCILQNK